MTQLGRTQDVPRIEACLKTCICTTGSQCEHAKLVSSQQGERSGSCVMWRNDMSESAGPTRSLTLWPTQEVSEIIQHDIVCLNLETGGLLLKCTWLFRGLLNSVRMKAAVSRNLPKRNSLRAIIDSRARGRSPLASSLRSALRPWRGLELEQGGVDIVTSTGCFGLTYFLWVILMALSVARLCTANLYDDRWMINSERICKELIISLDLRNYGRAKEKKSRKVSGQPIFWPRFELCTSWIKF